MTINMQAQTTPDKIGRTQDLVLVKSTYKDAVVLPDVKKMAVGLRIHTQSDSLLDDHTANAMLETLASNLASYRQDFQLYIGSRPQDLAPVLNHMRKMIDVWGSKKRALEFISTNLDEIIEEIASCQNLSQKEQGLKLQEISRKLHNRITGIGIEDGLAAIEVTPGNAYTAIAYLLSNPPRIEDEKTKKDLATGIRAVIQETVSKIEWYIDLQIIRGKMVESLQSMPRGTMRDIIAVFPGMLDELLQMPGSRMEDVYSKICVARQQFMIIVNSIGARSEPMSAEDLLSVIRTINNPSVSLMQGNAE